MALTTAMQRAIQMFTEHDEVMARNVDKTQAWYLEVIAVSPDAQGRGLGGILMQWMLQRIAGAPCILECTDEANVPFYEKYGFRVVEVTELKAVNEPDRVAREWIMVRPASKGEESED